MDKLRVLLVEDDENLGKLLSQYLKAKSFECTLCKNGVEGFDEFRKGEFDFLIFDVMMPEKDGFTLAKEVRALDKHVPILFLTAKSMKEDRLEGFDIGADDYMTKPFSMEELVARIHAIMKRVKPVEKEKGIYQIGSIDFDYDSRTITDTNEEHKLTTKESELLKILVKNKEQVVDRSDILKAVWGDDNYFNGRSMDVYITKLRKYLKLDSSIEIVNAHGKGFKLTVK